MAEVSSWLRGMRKYELVELAQEAGLQDYETLKKVDLETALDHFLRANETSLSKHSLFNPFYTRRRSTGSPVKRESAASGPPSTELEVKALKSRTRRTTKAAIEVAPSEDSSPERIANLIAAAVESTPAVVRSVPLPPSPAAIADVIDNSTAELRSKVEHAWEESGFTERIEGLRDYLSSVVSIESVVLAFEAFGLRSEVLPSRYAFTIPAIAGLGISGWPVYLPDLFMLLTSTFWAPLTLWASTSLFVPLLFAYFFNLTLRARHAQGGRGYYQTLQPTYKVDPLTFNIVKALASYVVYSHPTTMSGMFSVDTVDTIRRAVPGGVEGLMIGSSIGALASIYDAILKK